MKKYLRFRGGFGISGGRIGGRPKKLYQRIRRAIAGNAQQKKPSQEEIKQDYKKYNQLISTTKKRFKLGKTVHLKDDPVHSFNKINSSKYALTNLSRLMSKTGIKKSPVSSSVKFGYRLAFKANDKKKPGTGSTVDYISNNGLSKKNKKTDSQLFVNNINLGKNLMEKSPKSTKSLKSTKSPKIGRKRETLPAIETDTGQVKMTKGKPNLDKVYTSSTTKVDFAGPVKQRSFFTNFVSGKPTTKSVKQAAKLNGTKNYMLWSSLTDPNFKNPALTYKEYNEIVTGFNQKIFYSSQYLTSTWSQIYKGIYNMYLGNAEGASAPNPDDITAKTQNVNVYGVATHLNNKIVFRNNMNTTSAVVKVHLMALRQQISSTLGPGYYYPLDAMSQNIGVALEPIDSDRVIATAQAYPRPNVRTQVAGDTTMKTSTQEVANSHARYCLTVPGASPLESDTFNDRFTIVKTFTRTLDVGDDWTLNLRHTLGAGFRLDEAFRQYVNLYLAGSVDFTKIPVPYRIMVEVCGKRITAETNKLWDSNNVGEDKYVGTSPCSVSWEASQHVQYVLNSYGGTTPFAADATYLTSTLGGPLVKFYVKDRTSPEVPFNSDYWKLNPSIVPNTELIIKSQTTATVQTVTTTN